MSEKAGKILFFLLCISIFVGGYCYIHFTFLSAIRLLIVGSIIYYLCQPHKNKSELYYYALLFFFCYTLYTAVITLFQPYEFSYSILFNFLTIPMLIWAITGPACDNPSKYLKYFYYFCYVALIFFAVASTIEYFTNIHLYDSALQLNTKEFADKHSVSVFSHNPNDFAAILTLTLLFFLSYRKVFIPHHKKIIGIAITIVTLSILFITTCRTALCAIVIYFIFYFRNFIKHHRIASSIIGMLIIIGIVFYLFRYIDESICTRANLYLYAFISLFHSSGLGMGVQGDAYYYSQLNNIDLFTLITNSHSYIFQMLITSGILCFVAYILLFIKLEKSIAKKGRNEFWILPFLYIFLLFAPSSALLLCPHYLFFGMYVCYAEYVNNAQCAIESA